jgi:hypothetical protein
MNQNRIIQATTEKHVQKWFIKVMNLLSPNWRNKIVCRETNDMPYLSGYKPDLSIFNIDDIPDDSFNILTVQSIPEFKKNKRTIGFSDEGKGQLVDYLHILIEQQALQYFYQMG